MKQTERMIMLCRPSMSEEGSALILSILVIGVVLTVLMIAPQNFSRAQNLVFTQKNKMNADDSVAEVRSLLVSSVNCTKALTGQIQFDANGVPTLISPNGIFGAVDAAGIVPGGPGSVDRTGVIGKREIELSASVFKDVRLYVAKLHVASALPTTQTGFHSYVIPIYLGVDSANQVKFCQHTKIVTADNITIEDKICRLAVGADPASVFNPMAGVCQLPTDPVLASF